MKSFKTLLGFFIPLISSCEKSDPGEAGTSQPGWNQLSLCLLLKNQDQTSDVKWEVDARLVVACLNALLAFKLYKRSNYFRASEEFSFSFFLSPLKGA